MKIENTINITLTNDENHPGELGVSNAKDTALKLRNVTDESLGEFIDTPNIHRLDLQVSKREAMRRFGLRSISTDPFQC